MNCPKCGTPAAAGAGYCKRCGSALAAKTAAKAAAPSSSDEIDLMPIEPPKGGGYNAYEEPPELSGKAPAPKAADSKGTKAIKKAGAAPPSPAAPGLPSDIPDFGPPPPAPKEKFPLTLIVGFVVLGLLVGFIAWRVLRTENKLLVGNPKIEIVHPVGASGTRVDKYEASGTVTYAFDIEILDGELQVGLIQRSHKDPTNLPALKKLNEPFATMKKGDKEHFSGEFKTKEQWCFILMNDTKKPARAKLKLLATPK